MAERKMRVKFKRVRVNPSHRWTETETFHMLQAVADAVKDDPESYERPTSEHFYRKIATTSSILHYIPWTTMKAKMRHLKSTYTSEATRKVETVAAPLYANKGYQNRYGPNWELLKFIFGDNFSIKAANDMDTTQSSVNEAREDEHSLLTEIENSDNSEVEEKSTLDSLDISEKKVTEQTVPQSTLDYENFINNLQSLNPEPRANNVSPLHQLVSIQERKLELETRRLKLEEQAAKDQIEIRKLELQHQFEIRKLEIEKEERVEIEKLKLDNATEERIKKYELKLKLIQSYKTT